MKNNRKTIEDFLGFMIHAFLFVFGGYEQLAGNSSKWNLIVEFMFDS